MHTNWGNYLKWKQIFYLMEKQGRITSEFLSISNKISFIFKHRVKPKPS